MYNFVSRVYGNITGLVKAHKENYPFRVLTTGCGTAIENLLAFTEFFLSLLAQTHPAYIKDTTHFSNKGYTRKSSFSTRYLIGLLGRESYVSQYR